tara:strand:+ start:127 stop:1092 length:966 start_codon:yes stop_codon:yes gene_type:complete
MYNYHFSHGRTALLNGIKIHDIKKNDFILIPDYICNIVEIILKSQKLNVIKYEIKDDFSINLNSLKLKLKKNNIRALMVVNYFGFPQKLNFIKKVCEKKNILIIEDNSHGHGGLFNNKLLGTRGNFGFSSPRKVLKIYSGGFLYSPKKKTFNLPEFKINFKDKFINLISKNNNLKLFIKKYFIFKKDYSNPFIKRDNQVYNFDIDKYSLSKITKKNIEKEKSKRIINYNLWTKFIKKKNKKPIFKKIEKNFMIWCLPFYVSNHAEAKEWFKWGQKNGITVFSWPDLSVDNIHKNSKCFKRWKKLVCLPLDLPSNLLKKICN